jgi:hypothetical protein
MVFLSNNFIKKYEYLFLKSLFQSEKDICEFTCMILKIIAGTDVPENCHQQLKIAPS